MCCYIENSEILNCKVNKTIHFVTKYCIALCRVIQEESAKCVGTLDSFEKKKMLINVGLICKTCQ
jgi:hypothetical protein